MPAINSTPHFTSMTMRDQLANLFKELSEILNKFAVLLLVIIAAIWSDTGKTLFTKHHKLMMPLVLTIVLYFFLVIIGTILQLYNRSLLPIITCAMLVLASAVSTLALSIISSTIAWITLALWVGMFILVAYDYGVPKRIKNWIKGCITRSSGLQPR